METEQFDRLTTRLARASDRRTMLHMLGVAVLGAGASAILGYQTASAKRKKRHHRGGKRNGGGSGGNGGGGNGDGGNGGNGGGFPGQGTCMGGADACLGVGSPICTCDNGRQTGLCRTQMEGGTVCAIDITSPAMTTCDQCKTNGDCARLGFPPGSSCVFDSGPNCRNCQENTLGTCVAPCGFQPPA
jgi:hypothetical protein